MKKNKILVTAIFFSIFLFLPYFLMAQEADIFSPQITLKSNVLIPHSGQEVKIEAFSYFFNKDTANFDWFLDNTFMTNQSGQGIDKFSFIAGIPGQKHSLRLRVTTNDRKIIQKTIDFSVTNILITFKSQNYVPIFYEGKSLPIERSLVNIVVSANLKDSDKLNYRWYLDDKFLSSGINKTSIEIKITKKSGETHKITVFLVNQDNNIISEKSLIIPIVAPQALIYNENFILQKNFQKGSISKLLTTPFFFNIKSLNDLNYSWFINGEKEQAMPQKINTLQFEIPAQLKKIDHLLSVVLVNLNAPAESAQITLPIIIQ